MGVKTEYMAEINLLELNETMAWGQTYEDQSCTGNGHHCKIRGTGEEGFLLPSGWGNVQEETMKA